MQSLIFKSTSMHLDKQVMSKKSNGFWELLKPELQLARIAMPSGLLKTRKNYAI